MWTTTMLVVFGTAAAVCLYAYAGYPALLWGLSRVAGRPVRKEAVHPRLSVIVPAHDEEEVIGRKLRNTLAADYPADRLEVIVASDGSTDRTEEVVRGVRDPRVRLLALPRCGKVRALEAAAHVAGGEVLVLTDANAMLAPDALSKLVESFADPEVGGVCGRKVHEPVDGGDGTGTGESLYWAYVQRQKEWESRLGSVFGADGGLYAVRRELWATLAEAGQADDLALSSRVVLSGTRLVYEPRAVAREPAPADGPAEFRRKVRVVNHTLSALRALGPALWTSGFYSVQLLSQKLARYSVPLVAPALLLATASLGAEMPFFRRLLLAELAFLGLGLAGLGLRRTPLGASPPLALPAYFLLVNAAALAGMLSVLRRERTVAWSPRGGRDRAAPPEGAVHRSAAAAGSARRVLLLLATAASLGALAPVPGNAQEPYDREPEIDRPSPFTGTLRLLGLRFDNFFQAPEDVPHQEVNVARAQGSLAARLLPRAPLELYAEGAYMAYSDGMEAARQVGGGLRFAGRPVAFDLSGGLELDRPSFDVGDGFARMDARTAELEVAVRPVRWWRLLGLGEVSWESFRNIEGRDSRFHIYGGGTRVDISRRVLSVEAGAEWGERRGEAPNEELDQRDLLVQLRSTGVERLYVSLGFRYRTRDYVVEDLGASNLDRVDVRRQWTLSGEFPAGAPVALIGYFAFEDAASTKSSRNYETNLVGLGLSLGF